MDNFEFYSPTYFSFGKGAEEDVGKLARRFGATRVLIHYGSASAEKTGLLARVRKSLDDAGLQHISLGGVVPNPVAEKVYEGIKIARDFGADLILALGGGSVIDSAKAIAAGVPYNGDFWDFFSGKAQIGKALPVGAILTISAAGSEGSTDAVITKGKCKTHAGNGDHLRPAFAILNPALTATLPPEQIAFGGADIMAHLFERYFTNTKNVETTDRLIEGLLISLVNELPKAWANPADYESQANIMWAGMLAHNNAVGVGRVQDWSSHVIEHELSALYNVAHGAGLAVVFPAWMKYVMKHDIARFARLATNVWGINTGSMEEKATAGIQALERFWRSLELPKTLEDLGGKAEDIPYMAGNISYWDGVRIGSFMPLDKTDVEKIFHLMMK
jgi:alcohol dehydrogenase YqhD (iron-dependent ADH family)